MILASPEGASVRVARRSEDDEILATVRFSTRQVAGDFAEIWRGGRECAAPAALTLDDTLRPGADNLATGPRDPGGRPTTPGRALRR
ncbi:MAG: hypothetical protein KDK10_12570 [Maritimibacter sp.]|nr:hypothetical protein [Maritimibacter sp.]